MATFDRDNYAPEWPVVEYGVSMDASTSAEEARSVTEEVSSTLEGSITAGTAFTTEMGLVVSSSFSSFPSHLTSTSHSHSRITGTRGDMDGRYPQPSPFRRV